MSVTRYLGIYILLVSCDSRRSLRWESIVYSTYTHPVNLLSLYTSVFSHTILTTTSAAMKHAPSPGPRWSLRDVWDHCEALSEYNEGGLCPIVIGDMLRGNDLVHDGTTCSFKVIGKHGRGAYSTVRLGEDTYDTPSGCPLSSWEDRLLTREETETQGDF